MDALRLGVVAPAAPGALPPVQPPAPAELAASAAAGLGAAVAPALQIPPLPGEAPASVPTRALDLDATAALLAALTPLQAPFQTRAADAPPPAAEAAPAAATIDATPAEATTTAAAALLAAPDRPPLPDAASLAFALETALRFGAGVGALGAPLVQTPDLATGLVRDAAAVPRQRSLQAQAGGPGPEAFAHPRVAAPVQGALQAYRAATAPEETAALDLLV